MSPLSLVAVLRCLASVFGVINYHLLELPSGIGLMAVSMAASLGVFGLDLLFPQSQLRMWSEQILGTRQLPETLLNGALAFLLFAGALELDASALWKRKFTILLLSTASVFLATGLFAAGSFVVLRVAGMHVSFVWCSVLGALLAPTDPVSIRSVLARILRAVLAGESLFNDGAAVVVFSIALSIAVGAEPTPAPALIVAVFRREVIGGAVLGAASG